mmetsp:Transcript_39973/g.52283  ORF Transcript_39973/g.52283 Transcript_39973/m.52283 type:complete len:82 (-) Transcript_39973:1274-1519(-)
MDAIARDAAAANEGGCQRDHRNHREQHDREDVAIIAELLVLSTAEFVTLTEEPGSHASHALFALKTVRAQTRLALPALHFV